jgi:predicted transcriptional regulator
MDKIRFSISILGILILAVSVGEIEAQEIAAESIQILRIMEKDERAVIKTADGNMRVIKVGDVIRKGDLRVPGSGLRVLEIIEGRIVFEEKTDKGAETVIVRIEDGKQRVESIRKFGDKQPPLYAPK